MPSPGRRLGRPVPVARLALAVAAASLIFTLAAFAKAQRPGPGATAASAGWGTAQPVRGFAALPWRGKDINPSLSLSCASPGNCSGGGQYYALDAIPIPSYAIVVSEVHGAWGSVQLVPGVRALEKSQQAAIGMPSCAAPGYCSAAGNYSVAPAHLTGPVRTQVFVASQVGGVWSRARPLPGFAALDTGEQGTINSLSCAAPGDCAAVGHYTVQSSRGGQHDRAVVASQVNGVWQRARQPPGSALLNAGGSSRLVSVSCAAPGACAAAGTYTGQHQITHAFVISEARGTWSVAQPVRGAQAPSYTVAVSCAAPGECAAVGGSDNGQGLFVVSEVDGRWQRAQPVPGIAELNAAGDTAAFSSVSCASPGRCSAGGFYALAKPSGGNPEPTAAFVVSEENGVWGRAVEVPGTKRLNTGRQATVTAMSCAPVGVCTAGGYYTTSPNRTHAFVASGANGIWSRAQPVRGITALGGGASQIDSISCPAAGQCAATGHYLTFTTFIGLHLFVLSQH